MDQPATILRGVESAGNRKEPDVSRLQITRKVRETNPEESAELDDVSLDETKEEKEKGKPTGYA